MGKPPPLCIYCEARAPLTHDHVPPKAIFAKPRPRNLITVPACGRCNQTAAKDDEYFRTVLTLKHDTYNHPDVRRNLPAVVRAFEKPAKQKFARRFFTQIGPVEVRTPAGLYLGPRWGFDVDLVRLDRVVARTVRGLYWHETGEVLPQSARVQAWSEDGMRDLDAGTTQVLKRTILIPLASVPSHVIGNSVFEYRFQSDADCPHASAWILQFYRAVRFLCLTLPPSPNRT